MSRVRKPIDVDDLVRQYLSGESVNQLAVQFGVGRPTIIRRLQSRDIQPRGSSEAERLKWQRIIDPQARKAQVSGAHEARRGQVDAPEVKARRAATWFRKQQHIWPAETQLAEALRTVGVCVDLAKNIGPYNVDLALNGKLIAVEIDSHPVRDRGAGPRLDRLEYLLNQGWSVLLIYTKSVPLTFPGVTQKVLTYLQTTSLNESGRGQYGVIRGDGEATAIPGLNLHSLPAVEGFEATNKPTRRKRPR